MKLTTVEFDQYIQTIDIMYEDVSRYERLIGKLFYLTNTRPSIAFVVQTLRQFTQQPKMSHWIAVVRVKRYIKLELGKRLLIRSA